MQSSDPDAPLTIAQSAGQEAQVLGPMASLGRHDPVQPRPRMAPTRVINGVDVAPDTPLAFLMDLMEAEAPADYSPEQRLYHDRMRLEAAKAALPAVHARLAQVELNGRVAISHEQALEDLERGPAT